MIAPVSRGLELLWPYATADFTTPATRGRLCGCWSRDLGGIACISVYFGLGGWTEVNLALGEQLWRVLATLSCAWVIGGDFNMTAEDLEAGLPWLTKVGMICRTVHGTCRVAERWTNIDMFIVSDRLRQAPQSMGADYAYPSVPHTSLSFTRIDPHSHLNPHWIRLCLYQ